ncbi:MAG: putative DNA binding domain-containing protein [Chloroflexota bacterium]|nr:MAG: putative DNA binding domain-containing protein [Chloroflexota bacterium]
MVAKKHSRGSMKWRTMDLHIHTPASVDYQQPGVTYLEILQRAETRGLDIIAFADHNTISGYRQMMEHVERLEFLEKSGRLLAEEQLQLKEYRRLFNKILVLPGFEFTATFGFHILGIFPEDKPLREIEHILLNLNIPAEQLDYGSDTVGATTDVIGAYQAIAEGDGLAIAAHANSTHGVAMRGFTFGGQTRIAYTQDANLGALEVTDLEKKGRRTTAKFFSGTKPEYPRRMHCIQGSDAHRLTMDEKRKNSLGVGDRTTDVLIPEVSFKALKDLFSSNDFSRTRPHRLTAEPAYDFIRSAREEGANIVQDFHESISIRGGRLYAVVADISAFANTNGGTLFLGLNADPRKAITGISKPNQAITLLEKEIGNRISPHLHCTIDAHKTGGKTILRVLVPRGDDPPYVVDDYKIYVRAESETSQAVRDEIVSLVLRGKNDSLALLSKAEDSDTEKEIGSPVISAEEEVDQSPRTGVEVVGVEERDGGSFFTVRDLRNGNVVKNVTLKSARRLWHYALTQYAGLPSNLEQAEIQWQGDFGFLHQGKQGKRPNYDLVQRTPQGYRYYFGVTDDGIHGPWKKLVGQDEE